MDNALDKALGLCCGEGSSRKCSVARTSANATSWGQPGTHWEERGERGLPPRRMSLFLIIEKHFFKNKRGFFNDKLNTLFYIS